METQVAKTYNQKWLIQMNEHISTQKHKKSMLKKWDHMTPQKIYTLTVEDEW
jgi:hypothetical protein